MVKIDEFLSAVLADVTRSRVAADEVSRNLAERYRLDPILRTFPVPRATIGELSLEMAFAVQAVDADAGGSGVSSREERVTRALEAAAAKGAEQMVAAVMREDVRLDSRHLALDTLLGREQRQLTAAVGDAMAEVLLQRRNTLDQDNTRERVAAASVEVLVKAARARRATVNTEMRNKMNAQADKVAAGVLESARRAASLAEESAAQTPAVELLITQAELAGVPESAISRLRVTLSVADNEWVQPDADDDARLLEK